MKRGATRAALAALAVLLAGMAPASEWTAWRGPTQDGVSTETGLISSWSPEGDNLVWRAPFIGRSTPVVLDGQVCVIGREGEGIDHLEVVACYDAENGKLRWADRYPVYNTTVPFNRLGWASLVADKETGNIYSFGAAGQLTCYSHDGKRIWSSFTTETLGGLTGYGGRTQTPLIDGDHLIMNFVSTAWGPLTAIRHRYYAFDKRDGRLIWVAAPGGMPDDFNTQSGPVTADINGRHLIIAGNGDGWVYAMDAATGKTVWKFQLSERGLQSTVLVHGDRVFASHAEENVGEPTMGRLVCIDGTGSGDVTKTHEVWRVDEIGAGFPSPAYHDGRLYVVDNSANLHAFDAATGEEKWKYSLGTVGKASPVIADGKIYVTETNGRFHILKLGDAAAQSLDVDELTVDSGRYAEIYGSPAIAYGRIYFTTEGGLYCLGDKNKKITVPPYTPGPSRPAPGDGAAATLLVVPGDRVLHPGDSLQLEIEAYDAAGRAVRASGVEWSLEGLKGTLGADGRFTPAADVPFQAGLVRAKAGEASGTAGVRVIAPLPWSFDFESYAADSSPSHWIGAAGKYVVREVEGNKVLVKAPRERGLNRTYLYMGPDLSNYTIEADVWGAEHRRRRPDIGLIATGYTLDLMGAQQKLEVRSWPADMRMARNVDFAWQMGVWYHMKLRVENGKDKATIRGKVWPRGESEPAEWTITVEDPHPIAAGSPGLIAFSPVDLYYDNLKVTPNR